MGPSKKDWKLFMEIVPGWQEAYMERLVNEYIKSQLCRPGINEVLDVG